MNLRVHLNTAVIRLRANTARQVDRRCSKMTDEKILGIEGGGTKTAWALVADGAIVESGKLPPSNLRLTPLDQITKIFRVLPRERSEEHTSELQSHHDLVCRLLLEKKKKKKTISS